MAYRKSFSRPRRRGGRSKSIRSYLIQRGGIRL